MTRFLVGLFQDRDDESMLKSTQILLEKLSNPTLENLAQNSLGEKDDINATTSFLVPLYENAVISRYHPLIIQGVHGELANFVYPVYMQCLTRYGSQGEIILAVFRNSTKALNLLGKSLAFNAVQEQEKENPLFLSEGVIHATQELKEARVGASKGCPMLAMKTAMQRTLLSEFIISCVKFWIYRDRQRKAN